jgi:peptide chain release factor 3
MNKCDRPTRPPLDLIDELEKVLGIGRSGELAAGLGPTFKGVYDRLERQGAPVRAHAGRRVRGAGERVGARRPGDAREAGRARAHRIALEEIEHARRRGRGVRRGGRAAGEVTPVFFGSAMNNFGVQLLLDGFLKHSARPRRASPRTGDDPARRPALQRLCLQDPGEHGPAHRDRIAFVRVVSGKFERDMFVIHAQSGKRVRLGNATEALRQPARDRRRRDRGRRRRPRRQRSLRHRRHAHRRPHHRLRRDPRVHARVLRVPAQPAPGELQEVPPGPRAVAPRGRCAAVRAVGRPGRLKIALLAAVGPLQFEVLQYRLQNEYGAESRFLCDLRRSAMLLPPSPRRGCC